MGEPFDVLVAGGGFVAGNYLSRAGILTLILDNPRCWHPRRRNSFVGGDGKALRLLGHGFPVPVVSRGCALPHQAASRRGGCGHRGRWLASGSLRPEEVEHAMRVRTEMM